MPIVKLTARNVVTLPPGRRGRAEYVDETLPGLVLRVTANDSRSYCVRYGRERNRYTLGDARHLGLADARDRAREILGRVARGEDPQAARIEERRRAREQTATFEQLADLLVSKADLGDRTRYNWRRLLEARVYPAIGKRAPAEILRADVRELIEKIAKDTPVQANDTLKVVRWIFARAIEQDVVSASPCMMLRKPTRERPRDRTATNEELRSLWNATADHDLYGQAVRFAMLTGARREEVFSARWEELDREARIWKIPGARTKNASPHEVPIIEDLEVLLDEVAARSGTAAGPWIFPGRIKGRPLRPAFTTWSRILESAKIVGLTFHDIRRSVRDRLTRDLGVSFPVAEACIGHKPSRLTQTYAPSGVALKDKRRAFERWSAELHRIVTGTVAEKVARMPARA